MIEFDPVALVGLASFVRSHKKPDRRPDRTRRSTMKWSLLLSFFATVIPCAFCGIMYMIPTEIAAAKLDYHIAYLIIIGCVLVNFIIIARQP